MHRYKITFAYDGSNFAGFQVQPGERTVQQVLERAVNKIAKKPQPPLMVFGSGRTDAGVHALGQVAHFDLPYQIPGPSLVRALNSSLPLDVLVKEATEVAPDFHARFDAHHKRYRYRVVGGSSPTPLSAITPATTSTRSTLNGCKQRPRTSLVNTTSPPLLPLGRKRPVTFAASMR